MILASGVRLLIRNMKNVYESAESVYLRCISHEMILAARVRLLIRDMEMFMKAFKVCIHAWHIP